MVAIERPAPGASSKLIKLEGAPFWVLVVYMGFLRFLQIGLYGAIVIKVGGAYLTAVNGITSWTAFGGWREVGVGVLLGVIICTAAYFAWFFGKLAKAMDDEIDRRWGLKG
jgi:hypothetical protein